MSERTKARRAGAGIEERVAEYLVANPDFFERHQDLLRSLRVPHPCGGAVSLIERKVAVLEEQNSALRGRLGELVDVARTNGRLAEHMHELALAIVDAEGLDALLAAVKAVLRDEFEVERSVLRLAARPVDAALADEEEFAAWSSDPFTAMFESKRPQCGRLTREQGQALFGDEAEEIGSAVIIPLAAPGWHGLLAIASHDRNRFYPGMGTLFLTRMGALLSMALQGHLMPLAGSSVG